MGSSLRHGRRRAWVTVESMRIPGALRLGRLDRASGIVVSESGIPALEHGPERAVEGARASLHLVSRGASFLVAAMVDGSVSTIRRSWGIHPGATVLRRYARTHGTQGRRRSPYSSSASRSLMLMQTIKSRRGHRGRSAALRSRPGCSPATRQPNRERRSSENHPMPPPRCPGD
jgi:hypothetical protein